jgi:mono/diheme cytochrome c family protein
MHLTCPGALVAAMTIGAGALTAVAWAQQHQVPAPKLVVTEYDLRKAAAPPPLGHDELEGKKLFVQRCALCHDLLGQPTTVTPGPWVDAATVKRSETAVREKILNGSQRMPGWRYTLTPAQVDQLIAYMKTVTPDQRPKPPNQVAVPID